MDIEGERNLRPMQMASEFDWVTPYGMDTTESYRMKMASSYGQPGVGLKSGVPVLVASCPNNKAAAVPTSNTASTRYSVWLLSLVAQPASYQAPSRLPASRMMMSQLSNTAADGTVKALKPLRFIYEVNPYT